MPDVNHRHSRFLRNFAPAKQNTPQRNGGKHANNDKSTEPMKRFLSLLLSMVPLLASAQNIQLHYDLGRRIYPSQQGDRPNVTMTLEQFKADKWGSWFYFVDVDFSRKFTEAAYTEVAREFSIGKGGLAAHVEYDGGLNKEGSFQQAMLVGAAWNGASADFSKTYGVQVMYKRYFKSYAYTSAYHSMQVTGVWSLTFAQKKMTFSGFVDCWRSEKANGHGQLVVMTEPQLWYNITPHLSLGTEWEVSNNFVYNTYDDRSFFVNPTVGMKWNF